MRTGKKTVAKMFDELARELGVGLVDAHIHYGKAAAYFRTFHLTLSPYRNGEWSLSGFPEVQCPDGRVLWVNLRVELTEWLDTPSECVSRYLREV